MSPAAGTGRDRRTTLVLDRDALEQARQVLGTRTAKETVNRALQEVSRQAALHHAAALVRSGGLGIVVPEDLPESSVATAPPDQPPVPLYLADTSIWAWANKRSRPDMTEKLAERLERDEIATCIPVALEVMHRAETGDQYEELFGGLLRTLRWLDLDARASRRALQVQCDLAGRSHGNHRRPAGDYLIAAVGELAEPEVTTWFFDKDLRVICEHTGQRFEAESTTGAGH